MASKPVGIRLDEDEMKLLQGKAESLGMPPGTVAKQLVMDALRAPRPTPVAVVREVPPPRPVVVSAPPDPALLEELRAALAETRALRSELRGIRRNIYNLALALLVLQKPMTGAQANQWAKDNLTE